MKKFALGILISGLALSSIAAQEASIALEVSHAFFRQGRVSHELQDADVTLNVEITLTNVGDTDVIVPTSVIPRLEFSEDTLMLSFRFQESKDQSGKIVIPSVFQFLPVTLKPSESTRIVYAKEISPEYLRDRKIVVRYSSSPFLKERFSFWSGPLTAPSKLRGGDALLEEPIQSAQPTRGKAPRG